MAITTRCADCGILLYKIFIFTTGSPCVSLCPTFSFIQYLYLQLAVPVYLCAPRSLSSNVYIYNWQSLSISVPHVLFHPMFIFTTGSPCLSLCPMFSFIQCLYLQLAVPVYLCAPRSLSSNVYIYNWQSMSISVPHVLFHPIFIFTTGSPCLSLCPTFSFIQCLYLQLAVPVYLCAPRSLSSNIYIYNWQSLSISVPHVLFHPMFIFTTGSRCLSLCPTCSFIQYLYLQLAVPVYLCAPRSLSSNVYIYNWQSLSISVPHVLFHPMFIFTTGSPCLSLCPMFSFIQCLYLQLAVPVYLCAPRSLSSNIYIYNWQSLCISVPHVLFHPMFIFTTGSPCLSLCPTFSFIQCLYLQLAVPLFLCAPRSLSSNIYIYNWQSMSISVPHVLFHPMFIFTTGSPCLSLCPTFSFIQYLYLQLAVPVYLCAPRSLSSNVYIYNWQSLSISVPHVLFHPTFIYTTGSRCLYLCPTFSFIQCLYIQLAVPVYLCAPRSLSSNVYIYNWQSLSISVPHVLFHPMFIFTTGSPCLSLCPTFSFIQCLYLQLAVPVYLCAPRSLSSNVYIYNWQSMSISVPHVLFHPMILTLKF